MVRATDDDRAWHLDKRVPIAMIITLALQTCAIVWWAATVQSRVEVLEKKVDRTEGQAGKIIRLEDRLDHIAETLTRIERALSKNNPTFGMQ